MLFVDASQEIVAAARREASDLDDETARGALLLRTKRDLYLLAFDGVVDLLKRSEAPDAGAILEAVKDIFSDICDDWRDLTHKTRRDAELNAANAKRANAAKDRAEASLAELYAVAKNAETESRRVKRERDTLAKELSDALKRASDAERLSREAIASAKARASMRVASPRGDRGDGVNDAAFGPPTDAALPTSASPRGSERGKPLRPLSGTPTETKSSAVDSAEAKRREASRRLEARLEYRPPPEAMPSYESDPGSPAADSASESASDHSPARLEQRDRDADDALAAVAALRVSNKVSASRAPKKAAVSPVAPSTASPSARGKSAPKTVFGVASAGASSRSFLSGTTSTTPFDAAFAENKPPPRWAMDTASTAAAAAAARGLGRGGAGQFGPDKSLTVSLTAAAASPRPKQLPAFGELAVRSKPKPSREPASFFSGAHSVASREGTSTRARRGSFPGGSPASANGSESDRDSRASISGLARDPSLVPSSTVASARPWTLKQLREVVEEIVAAKVANDARQARNKKPRETMREHVYTFLNHKFGVKAVIAEWAESIAAATERFSGVDCEMAVFDRITRNVLDEEYFQEQRMVADTVEELLKSYVRSKLGSGVSDETAREAFAKKKAGDLYDEEWLDMCRFMYGGREMAGVVVAVREAQRANENASYDEELRRLVEENRAVGTRRRPVADLEAEARRRSRKRLPYKDFVQTCLFHGLGAHEDALAPVVDALQRLGVLRDGFMSEAQFTETCARTRPDLSDAQVEALVLRLDPWNAGRITCSGCYAALVPGLGAARDEAVGRGLPKTEESKASLGGVGHGALFTPSYDGNVFGAK